MIFFDEDCNARYYRAEAGTILPHDLDPAVDLLEGTDTGVFVVGVNGMNPCYPGSRVMKSFTDGFDMTLGLDQPWMEGSRNPWPYRQAANTLVLWNHGVDSSQYLMDRARDKGMAPWVTIRMNDQHSTWIERCPGHSDFWMDHPELRTRSHFPESGLSYEHTLVRETFFALAEEIMEKYDAEGYVIDWMRHVPHFDDDAGEVNIPHLNDFMKRVRALADNFEKLRGHAIEIAARIPSAIRSARRHGLDGVTWAKSGYVNRLIISQKYIRNYEIDANAWKQAIGKPGFPVTATVDAAYQPYPGYPAGKEQGVWLNEPYDRRQLPFIRGACRMALAHGSDGIYYFNFMGLRNRKDMPEIFTECGDLNKLCGRNFAVDITYDDLEMDESDFLKGWRAGTTDAYFKGWRDERKARGVYPYQLPQLLSPGETCTLIFRTGPVSEVIHRLALRFEGITDAEVTLNSTLCRLESGKYVAPSGIDYPGDHAVVTVKNTSCKPYELLRASLYFTLEEGSIADIPEEDKDLTVYGNGIV